MTAIDHTNSRRAGKFQSLDILNFSIDSTIYRSHVYGVNTSNDRKRIVVIKAFPYPIGIDTIGRLAFECVVIAKVTKTSKKIHVLSAYPR
jgi:hypothetical protein